MTSVHSTISDHIAIRIHLNMSKLPRPTRILFRNIWAIDQNCLADDIRECAILRHPAMELDPMVCQYNSTLRTLLDKQAPLKSKTFPVRKMISWFSDEIENARQQRRKRESLWRRPLLTGHRQMYQAQKRLLNNLMNSEKAKFLNDKIVSCAGNQSTLFKTVDGLLHRKAVQSLPAQNNIQELADRFIKYFISKIVIIRQVLDTSFQ